MFKIYCLKGRCIGEPIATQTTANARDCLLNCYQMANCQWFSYDESDGSCEEVASCEFTDETSADWIHGQTDCDPGLYHTIYYNVTLVGFMILEIGINYLS